VDKHEIADKRLEKILRALINRPDKSFFKFLEVKKWSCSDLIFELYEFCYHTPHNSFTDKLIAKYNKLASKQDYDSIDVLFSKMIAFTNKLRRAE